MWQTTLIANLIIGNHTFFNSLFRASFPWERENTDVSNRDHYYSISLTKIIHTVDACPVHCRLFSSLIGFYLLDATSTLLILSTKNVNILFVFLRIRNTKKKRCHEMKEPAKLICSAFWIQKESVKLILLRKSIKLEIWVWIFFCTFEVLITCPQEHRAASHKPTPSTADLVIGTSWNRVPIGLQFLPLLFFSILIKGYLRAWSVGFINFPLLVDDVDLRPMLTLCMVHLFIKKKKTHPKPPGST